MGTLKALRMMLVTWRGGGRKHPVTYSTTASESTAVSDSAVGVFLWLFVFLKEEHFGGNSTPKKPAHAPLENSGRTKDHSLSSILFYFYLLHITL